MPPISLVLCRLLAILSGVTDVPAANDQEIMVNRKRSRRGDGRYGLPAPLLLLLLTVAACDFRDPEEGYDEGWNPDHDRVEAPVTGEAAGEVPEDRSGATVVVDRRPADIIADTAGMNVRHGVWQEELEGESNYRIYAPEEGAEPEMIVERTGESTRTYFFNEGILFYYTEESHDGSFDLTVEFDDFGDVRGAQKLRDGSRVPPSAEDYARVVERAMEIRSAR